MPRAKKNGRDGVFMRRGSYYISYNDAQGRRKQRKLKGAHTLTQARGLREAELAKIEKAQTFGYMPPTETTFEEFMPRYLAHQRARLTAAAYERTRGIVEGHLKGQLQSGKTRRHSPRARGTVCDGA